LLSWSIYGLDELEAKAAEEWRNAEIETDVREGERRALQNGQAQENGEEAEDDRSAHSNSSARLHLPEIIPRLSSNSVIPIDNEGELKRQRFSQIATEVLCADVWEIQSRLAGDLEGFLEPFWEAALGYGVTNGMWDRPEAPRQGESEEEWRKRQRRYTSVQQAYEARHVAPPSSSSSAVTSDEDDKRREILRNNFTRVNNALLAHHGAAVFTFVQTLPDVLTRILDRIESTAMQDLVLKLLCLEEQGVPSVTNWFASQHLIPQLYRRMSPHVNATTHTVIFDLIKAIVALSSPGSGPGAAGAFNPNGGNGQDQNVAEGQGQVITSPTDGGSQAYAQQGEKEGTSDSGAGGGQRDNQLIREMVNKENVEMLIGYMFDGALPSEEESAEQQDVSGTPSMEISLSASMTVNGAATPTYTFDPYETPRLPSHASINSSFCNIINIFIELIRKNNSDFAEPHLFHTMRNRLIRLKQRAVEDRAEQRETERKSQAEGDAPANVQTEEEMDEIDRSKMEDVMAEMSGRMGIVHLGALMDALSGNVDKLQAMIEQPRSLVSVATRDKTSVLNFMSLQSWSRTPGNPTPLTQERFRIMELYAELLHCSNMSILNRQLGQGPDYSSSGCLEGGLEALEKLGSALEGEAENAEDHGEDDEFEGEVQKAKELPVSATVSATHSRSTSEHGDGMEEVSHGHVDGLTATNIGEGGPSALGASVPPLAPPPPSQADVARLRDVLVQHPRIGDLAHGTSTAPDSEMAAVSSNVAVASTTTQSVKDENMEDHEVHADSQRNTEVEHADEGFEYDDVLPVGDKLKQLLIRHHVMRSVVVSYSQDVCSVSS
jgi:SIT4-associating protein SAP185/190